MLRFVALALSVVVAIGMPPVQAESAEPTSGLTFYSAHGIDTNLPDLPGRLVHRTLEYDDTYFTGVSYTVGTRPPSLMERAFRAIRVDGVSTGVEFLGVKHRGLQDHFESSVLYRLNSPYLGVGPVQARLGYGLGLSYAHGTPWYERSPDDDRKRLLTYMSYELELRLRRIDRVSLVTRIHHRSGAYGLFAPRGSGSNFLAVGVRTHW